MNKVFNLEKLKSILCHHKSVMPLKKYDKKPPTKNEYDLEKGSGWSPIPKLENTEFKGYRHCTTRI